MVNSLFTAMAKTRAEIQKAYRQRKKAKEGGRYKQREVKRVQKYYRSTADLSKSELQERRQAIRQSVAKHREAKRRMSSNESSSNGSIQSSSKVSKRRLVISLDFNKPRKRSRALKKAKKEISSLEQRVRNLEKSNQRMRKRNQRLVNQNSGEHTENNENTPRTRTKEQLKEAGLRPKQVHPSLRKRLLFSNVLVTRSLNQPD